MVSSQGAATFFQSSGVLSVSGNAYVGPFGDGTMTQNGADSFATLTIGGSSSGTGTYTLAGGTFTAGAVTIQHGSTFVDSGGVRFATGPLSISASSKLSATVSGANSKLLDITGAIQLDATSSIDLADNDLIQHTSGVYSTLQTYISVARHGGLYNQPGFTSSSAALQPTHTALGLMTGAEYIAARGAGTLFDGSAVVSADLLVKYTYLGDANFDGKVDVADLGILATHWQTAGDWSKGDFDYSAFVDVGDLGALATNWQAGVSNPLGPGSFAAALASLGLPNVSVPEPTWLMIYLTIAPLAVRRRW